MIQLNYYKGVKKVKKFRKTEKERIIYYN